MKLRYQPDAPKQTVRLTINSDLHARAKRLGINASQIAEQALAREVARLSAEQLCLEIKRDLEASNAYANRHGSFSQMVRDHYQRSNDD